MLKIKEAMEYMAPWMPKRQPTINRYCQDGTIPSKRQGDLWYIDELYIKEAVSWRKTAVTTEELLAGTEGFSGLNDYDKAQCMRNVSRQTAKYLAVENRYSILFAGRFVDLKHLETVRKLIGDIVKQYVDRANMLPAAVAAEKLEVSVYQLKRLISEGKIKAEVVKNNWYLTETEIQKFADEKEKYIGLTEIVKGILTEIKTTFDIENHVHRAMMNARVRNSKLKNLLVTWEETGLHGDRRNSYYVPADSKPLFEELLRPYLKQYGLSEVRLEMLSSDDYWNSHPKTWDALQLFAENKLPNGISALMETIIESLDSEVMDADDEEIDNMIDYSVNAMTEIYQMYTSMFLKFVAQKYECNFTMVADYRTGKAHKKTVNSTPYSVDEYFAFAYMNYNDDFIKEHQLVEKAVNDPKMAYLWWRSCMHYTAMWRDSDLKSQIPVVKIKLTKKKLKERILSGEFSEKEADELSILLEMIIQEKAMSPHKTGKEVLRVHFPETLRPIIGLSYACCLLHADSDYIEGMTITAAAYRNFYGEDYVRLFGMKTFSNRRANKSYADALVTITERTNDNEHKVRGYIIAGYARSHTMKKGQIPAATYNYLQYKLDGLSDNEVIKMLLDMGTCSFVVNMLLEAVYGEPYKQLPVEYQAEIVKETGLTANTAELVSDVVLKAYRRSKKLAEELLESYPTIEGQKKACKDAMVNIIEGRAAAKDAGINCLNLAFLRPCIEPNCEHCPGCENAILHKGAFFTVFKVLEDAYRKLRQAKTEGSAKKYQALINQKYLPAAIELLSICKTKYGMDISECKDKIQRLILNEERKDEKC